MGRLIQRVLASDKCCVTVCTGTDSALEVIFNQPADVVLLDITLASVASAELVMLGKMGKTPVIILTDVDDEAVLVDCVEAGAFDLLLKPFTPEQLEQCVSLALSCNLDGKAAIGNEQELPASVAGRLGDKPISLSELRFLAALTARPAQTVLYQEILRSMYGRNYREYARLAQAWATRLKQKVRLSEFMGVGYALAI